MRADRVLSELIVLSVIGVIGVNARAQDMKEVASGDDISWNKREERLIEGIWAGEKGIGKFPLFPKRDPRGDRFKKDFMKWASFLLKPDFLPKRMEDHLIPLRMGQLPVLGARPPNEAIEGKDGFIVRYNVGTYLLQLADTRYDFRIVLKDKRRSGSVYPREDRLGFGKEVMQRILTTEITEYHDGTLRKLNITQFRDHTLILWNWQSRSKKEDEASGAGTVANPGRPFYPFVALRTDGRSALLSFSKSYPTNVHEVWITSKRSRFEKSALFHDTKAENGPNR